MERHSSCRSVIPVIKYVESNGINPEELIYDLPVDFDYLKNPRNWVSRDLFADIFERCEMIFDDPLIMYKIGQEAWVFQSGAFLAFIRLLLSPNIFLKFAPNIVSYIGKFFWAESELLGPHEAQFHIYYKKHSMAHRHGCLYNMGWIVGLPKKIWKTKAWVKEEKCVLPQELDSIRNLHEKPLEIDSVRFNNRRCTFKLRWVEPRYAGYIKTFLDNNEDLLNQALAALESKELNLQEKEYEIQKIKHIHSLQRQNKAGFFAQLGLTQREIDVVISVTKGKTNIEISEYLGISAETVKKHLNNIYRKLKVRSRTELSAKIFEYTDLN